MILYLIFPLIHMVQIQKYIGLNKYFEMKMKLLINNYKKFSSMRLKKTYKNWDATISVGAKVSVGALETLTLRTWFRCSAAIN